MRLACPRPASVRPVGGVSEAASIAERVRRRLRLAGCASRVADALSLAALADGNVVIASGPATMGAARRSLDALADAFDEGMGPAYVLRPWIAAEHGLEIGEAIVAVSGGGRADLSEDAIRAPGEARLLTLDDLTALDPNALAALRYSMGSEVGADEPRQLWRYGHTVEMPNLVCVAAIVDRSHMPASNVLPYDPEFAYYFDIGIILDAESTSNEPGTPGRSLETSGVAPKGAPAPVTGEELATFRAALWDVGTVDTDRHSAFFEEMWNALQEMGWGLQGAIPRLQRVARASAAADGRDLTIDDCSRALGYREDAFRALYNVTARAYRRSSRGWDKPAEAELLPVKSSWTFVHSLGQIAGSPAVAFDDHANVSVVSAIDASLIATVAYPPHGVTAVALGETVDGLPILAIASDYEVTLHSLPGGAILSRVEGAPGLALSAAFGPPSSPQVVAVGGGDMRVHLWDIATGRRVCAPLEGHTDDVMALRFVEHGDQTVLFSSDMEGSVWRWILGDSPTGDHFSLGGRGDVELAVGRNHGEIWLAHGVGEQAFVWNAVTRRPVAPACPNGGWAPLVGVGLLPTPVSAPLLLTVNALGSVDIIDDITESRGGRQFELGLEVRRAEVTWHDDGPLLLLESTEEGLLLARLPRSFVDPLRRHWFMVWAAET